MKNIDYDSFRESVYTDIKNLYMIEQVFHSFSENLYHNKAFINTICQRVPNILRIIKNSLDVESIVKDLESTFKEITLKKENTTYNFDKNDARDLADNLFKRMHQIQN